jgi:hypothetical protein
VATSHYQPLPKLNSFPGLTFGRSKKEEYWRTVINYRTLLKFKRDGFRQDRTNNNIYFYHKRSSWTLGKGKRHPFFLLLLLYEISLDLGALLLLSPPKIGVGCCKGARVDEETLSCSLPSWNHVSVGTRISSRTCRRRGIIASESEGG